MLQGEPLGPRQRPLAAAGDAEDVTGAARVFALASTSWPHGKGDPHYQPSLRLPLCSCIPFNAHPSIICCPLSTPYRAPQPLAPPVVEHPGPARCGPPPPRRLAMEPLPAPMEHQQDPAAPGAAPEAPAATAVPAAPPRKRPGRPATYSGCQICGTSLADAKSFHQVRRTCCPLCERAVLLGLPAPIAPHALPLGPGQRGGGPGG